MRLAPGPNRPASRVVFLVWRDTDHPEGGGSEVYVEHMAAWLAAEGVDVTIVAARHDRGPADEVRDGVTFRRRGGRLTVYLHGLAYLLTRAGRCADLVIDVQNGLPFWSPLVRRRTVRVLVHHVHREQWQMIYPGWPGRLGWWLESRLAPRVYRRCRYLTVSQSTVQDLGRLGVPADRIDVVHNGIDVPHPGGRSPSATEPTICVLGRLVPHKQVEHALRMVSRLADEFPALTLDIVGDGWWRPELDRLTADLDVGDRVTFHGHVSAPERDRLLDRAWLLVQPSIKEGWGISIMEAAARGVPTVAYRTAGGVTESISDRRTGWLVEDEDDLAAACRELLLDRPLRTALGVAARRRAVGFDWPTSARHFAKVSAPDHSDRR